MQYKPHTRTPLSIRWYAPLTLGLQAEWRMLMGVI